MRVKFGSPGRIAIILGYLCLVAPTVQATEDTDVSSSHGTEARGFRVGAFRNWLFFSFLPEDDEAKTLGLETESYFPLGGYEVKNISYLELADYPRPIPGQPPGSTATDIEIDDGINDLMCRSAAAFSATSNGAGKS